VAFFDADAFNAAANILDNILFGKVAYGQAQASEKVGRMIGEVVDALGLHEAIVNVGLDFEVGIGGSRLTQAQRQKLAIARAVIKRPDVLFLDEATASLDGASQSLIMDNIMREFAGRGLVWSLHRPALAERFDRVLVMRDGRVDGQGSYGELARAGTRFHKLLVEI
jgi:ABC-type multidrug transport system fused ATPase/permease subunit